MSSYPPPPPPASDPYSPPYSRAAQKAQERMLKDQAKFQRAQMRQQARLERRTLRRGSILGPLLILAVGVVFLLAQLNTISWPQALDWYGRWWPALLVVAGLILVAEWGLDQRLHGGTGGRPVRVLGGGVVLLLILLTLAGLSAHGVESGLGWKDRTWGTGWGDLDQVLGNRHEGDSTLDAGLPEQGVLTIHDPRGDITISGSSTDGQVHVSVHTQAYAWKDSEAESKTQQLQPAFTHDGKNLLLSVASVTGGQADLTVTVPAATPVIVRADRGDVNLSQLSAPLSLSANHGDVEISNISAGVRADVNDDDATLTLHGVTGPVSITGHTGDINMTDVTGAVQLEGDFYGTTYLQHIDGSILFQTSRTRFSAARLDGEFSVENDSLDASAVLGPVVLKTSDKNITLERAQGDVEVSDSNGTIEVTTVPHPGAIAIENRHGSVDLGLPSSFGFVLKAQTRNGDMENDFGLTPESSGETHTLEGTVHGGGPTVTIATSDGDVTVRKSSMAPLVPLIPSPPPPPSPPGPPSPPSGLGRMGHLGHVTKLSRNLSIRRRWSLTSLPIWREIYHQVMREAAFITETPSHRRSPAAKSVV